MIDYSLEDDFRNAFLRSLSTGEVPVNLVAVYTESWGKVWVELIKQYKDVFQGFNWFMLGLTNINLRIFGFKVEERKVGFMKKEYVTLPEVVNMTSVPIRNISSFGKRQFDPVKAVKKAHANNFRTDVGDICAVNVKYPNGFLDCGSPYHEMAALAANLEAALSGASLASQANSTADAVSRLATLHNEGVLTDDEFARAKQGFMGASVEVGESATSTIRQLHSLFKAGVLSESEFNMKKWDVLSRPS